MPFGAPSIALDRRFLTCSLALRTTGPNISVTYTASKYNPATDVIAVGGDAASAVSYMGLLSDGIFGDLIEAAAIPALGGQVTSGGIAVNKNDGGWLVIGANNLFRGPADMSSWTDITAPAVVTRFSVLEWRGRLYVGKTHNAPLFAGDIEFSDNNGATWDTDPGINTGMNIGVVDGLVSDPGETVMLAFSRGGSNAAVTRTTGAATGTWTVIPIGNAGVVTTDAAISDDGRKAVIVSNFGSIDVSSDGLSGFSTIPLAANPFQSSALSVWPIENVVYVADLGGFVLRSNIATGRQAFIDENEMTTVFMTSYLSPDTIGLGKRCGSSDGFQAFFLGGSNMGVATLRKIGQTGKS